MEVAPDKNNQKGVGRESTPSQEWGRRFDILRTRLDQQVANHISESVAEDMEEEEALLAVDLDKKDITKQLDNFIETKVNFSLLQDLLVEVFRKAGAKEEKLEKIKTATTSEAVVFIGSQSESAFFIQGGEKVYFAVDAFLKDGHIRERELLETLIHEFLHLLSEQVHEDEKEVHSGLMHGLEYGDVTQVYFEGVNEGMTEMLQDCLLSEYLKRSGDANKFVTDKESVTGYTFQRNVLDVIITEISKETGISKETIFKGMVEAYCSNRSLFSEEIFGKLENPLLRKYILLVSDVDSLETSPDFGIKKKKTIRDLALQILSMFKREDNSRYYVQALFGEDYRP